MRIHSIAVITYVQNRTIIQKKPQSRKRRIIANYRILYVQDHHWHMGEVFLTISHPIYLTQININNNMFGGQVLNQFSINLYRSFQQC